jgi:hypothetical protein
VLGLLGTGVALAVAAASYSGHTSQTGHRVKVSVNQSNLVSFSIDYDERCYTPAGKVAGTSNGSFSFVPSTGVSPDPEGNFSHHAAFNHVKTNSGNQFFNSSDDVTGKLKAKSASGTFAFTGRFYSNTGKYLGQCKTGTLSWSAKKK